MEILFYGKEGWSLSILSEVREAMGLEKDDTGFDVELKLHISGALHNLSDQGGISVHVDDPEWFNYDWVDMVDNHYKYQNVVGLVSEYVVLHVRILFDPPPPKTQAFMEEKLKELEWRYQGKLEDYDRFIAKNPISPMKEG